MTTVLIEENCPQAKRLLDYIETLPFATVKRTKKKSAWDEAIAEGAVTLDKFDARFKEEIRNAYKA